ncbi:hypothetical protein LZ32DRAFT_610470 [Colletotrichum eremochloae]|nr:hypothetical protein LZ32DRAFT_610470 [Colletotrichum eremochloae]
MSDEVSLTTCGNHASGYLLCLESNGVKGVSVGLECLPELAIHPCFCGGLVQNIPGIYLS